MMQGATVPDRRAQQGSCRISFRINVGTSKEGIPTEGPGKPTNIIMGNVCASRLGRTHNRSLSANTAQRKWENQGTDKPGL